jgi:hypothetical protein
LGFTENEQISFSLIFFYQITPMPSTAKRSFFRRFGLLFAPLNFYLSKLDCKYRTLLSKSPEYKKVYNNKFYFYSSNKFINRIYNFTTLSFNFTHGTRELLRHLNSNTLIV